MSSECDVFAYRVSKPWRLVSRLVTASNHKRKDATCKYTTCAAETDTGIRCSQPTFYGEIHTKAVGRA